MYSKKNCSTFFLIFIWSAISCDDEFKSVPTTVKAPENDTVLLPCYLETITNDGMAYNHIRWYRNGKLLADSGPPVQEPPERYKLWVNGSLEVVNLDPDDTGEYMCEIVRPLPWSTVQQVHAIEVLHPPSVEPDPPDGYLQVKLGDEVKMSCKVQGVPFPLISWMSKGQEMQLLDSREILRFTVTDRNLEGEYECVAKNGVGEPARATIFVNVVYAPELTAIRSWAHSAPSLRVQLECIVSADPPPTVSWLKSETPVNIDSRVISLVNGDKYTLLIRNVRVSDFGIYTCRASNDLGQSEMQIQLSGVSNPAIFKKIEQKNLNTKSSYKLLWEVDSYTPIIEYNLWFRPYRPREALKMKEWLKLTIPAEHSTGPMYTRVYTLTGLKEKTVYETLLVSRNRYGWSKPSQILRFATDGADPKEEVITPVHIETQGTIISYEITSVSSNGSKINLNYLKFYFYVYFILRPLQKYLLK